MTTFVILQNNNEVDFRLRRETRVTDFRLVYECETKTIGRVILKTLKTRQNRRPSIPVSFQRYEQKPVFSLFVRSKFKTSYPSETRNSSNFPVIQTGKLDGKVETEKLRRKTRR